jgi:hypothetical protein
MRRKLQPLYAAPEAIGKGSRSGKFTIYLLADA